MTTPIDIDQLCQGFDVHMAHLAAAQDQAADPGMHEFVGSLIEKLQAGRDYFQNDYANKMQAAEQRIADSIRRIEQQKQNYEQLVSKQAAAAAATQQAAAAKPEKPSPPPAPPVDTKLGSVLRRELLKRFAGDQLEQPIELGPREIWEDWDGWSNN